MMHMLVMQIEDVSELRAKYESLQRSHRNFLVEELEPFSLKELHNLEKQLDKTLSQARSQWPKFLGEELEPFSLKDLRIGFLLF
ncbi:MADS-box transcription factor 6-like [Cucumis melo var. makuwa]|uniref:MADS-box transcription factor 6-like n=1 Tax=Cucumis melo var. makuwa TaxID=1194695 RepID=A0A5D3CZV1_CUCMM|nr:MADS-box transcription factor 6-like [Cucumis melo var. makuwa]